MKKSVLTILIFCVTGLYAQNTQIVFGVKQASQNSSAYFGIKQNRAIITLGSDFFEMGLDGSYETVHQPNASLKEKTTLSFDGNALLLVPQLGVKYFLTDSKQLKPYIHGDCFISFPVFSLDIDGSEETWNYADGVETNYTNDPVYYLTPGVEKAVKDALGFWGFSLAFGTEFFIHEQFSIGAEYGLRYLFDRAEYKGKPMDEWEFENIDELANEDVTLKVKYHLGIMYSLISLNYYF